MTDFDQFETRNIKDVVITNHNGEKKGTSEGLKGILMKDLLDKVQFKVESPKQLSEFFLTFEDSDGYKVVFSWNEIFNTATGDNLYLITEKEGKKITAMDERILIISTTDYKTGRRNVKGLQRVIVGRAP